jgi:hypothetical protein
MPFEPRPAQPWHVLFAPLPEGAVPRRSPVAAPGTPGAAEGSPIAGWQSVVLDLSDPGVGMRVVMATLDGEGRLLGGSDMVMYRAETAPGVVESLHESVGGRFEPDGTFRGTRWRSLIVERDGDEDDRQTSGTPSAPTEADVTGIRRVVAELLRRAPS